MIRVYVFVEGQTEETFVREVLAPHYAPRQIFLNAILAQTSPGYKGGIVGYGKVKHQLERLCKQDCGAYVTTMIDLYRLPNDFPGKNAQAYPVTGTPEQKVTYLEHQLAADINQPNFFPNLMLHEYEALLFCQPSKFSDWVDDAPQAVNMLQQVRNGVDTPEQINDSPHTAPSRRILDAMPQYQKALHGPLIAADIGLEEMRKQCPHFNQWLCSIEQLAVANG